MRRIQLIFVALAIVVASLVAISGPAMADNLNCRDARDHLIRCNGDLYAPYNNYWNPYRYVSNSYWNPYYYNSDSFCPFWDDTEGIVNQWDCFD